MTRITPDDAEGGFATRAVHAGQHPDPLTGAVMTPIYQTSTYVQDGLGRHKGYEYARTQNPTREALERNIANLEGAEYGFAFSSGLSAVDAVLKLLSAGDHVVAGENLYGGTHRMMERIFARFGLTFSFVEMQSAFSDDEFVDEVHPKPRITPEWSRLLASSISEKATQMGVNP